MSKKSKKSSENELLWKLSIVIFLVVLFGYWYLSVKSNVPQTSEEFNKLKIKYSNLLEELATKEMLLEEAAGKLRFKPKQKEKTFLFIGILSSPTNYERRQAVRNTWVNLVGEQSIVWKFFIGDNLDKKNVEDKIKIEESQYKDIVRISNTPEVYDKLIEKTLNVMKWVNENYELSYFMKTDDDSFIRPDLLIQELITRNNPTLTYMGFIHQRSFVYRHPSSKFYEPDFNDCETHLPYASGAGYILTQDLINYLTNTTAPFRKFKNEDAGIGFLLAPIKLNRVHEPRMHPEREGKGKELCPVTFFLQHRLEPGEFENCYKYITTGNYKE